MNLIKKITASAALVALVSGFFTTSVSAADSAAIEAANKLAKAGIVVDHSDNTSAYELSRNVLRQEIAAVSRGIAGVEKATTYKGTFSDVTKTTPNTWAWQTVEALAEKGLIAKNNKFRPEDNITKSEGIGMVVKACYGNEYNYGSSKAGSWQDQVVAFASSKGMVAKFSDYNAMATRGFVFKAAANCLQDGGEEADSENVDDLLCQTLGLCDGEKEIPKDEENKKEETTKTDKNVTLDKDVLVVELSPETPEDGDIAAGSARVKMLAFDVTAGNTDVTLKNLDLKFTGLGEPKDVTTLAVYDGLDKVTKGSKKFQSDDTATLSFDKDTVIKAGETKTLFVTSTIRDGASDDNQTLQITLTGLDASSTVELDGELVGAVLQPILVRNVGKLELKSVNKISNTINVGEVATLAKFTLDETSDKEDVEVKSISMQLDGSFDSDDLGDLALYADGKEIDADFEIKSSELEIELNQVVPQDKNVKFELKGSVSGSVNDDIKITFEEDAIYAVGKSSEVSIDIDTTNDDGSEKELADIDIDGSEINIAFKRSDRDEAKPGADDVLLGTIDLSSGSDYTISELTITVENTSSSNSSNIEDIIKTLELDGTTYDEVSNEGSTKAVYTFEDIDISSEEEKLALEADIINDTEINGSDLEITLDVVKVKDEDNNKTYTENSDPDLDSILSNNAFKTKTLEIKAASVEIASTEVNNTEVVLGNGIKVVVYKGKISVGDADDIVLSDLNLEKSSDYNTSVDVDDIISSATLNIGGKTFKGDVENDSIEFNNINATIAAGADNVTMLVVATLKDNDDVSNGATIGFQIDQNSVEADDSEGDEVLDEEITFINPTENNTKVTLNDRGTFYVATTANGDNEDDVEASVLAGTKSVNLGEVEIQADMEDADVNKLTFVVAGEADLAGTAGAGSLTATVTTTQTGATAATSFEKTKVTVDSIPTKGGTVNINLNGGKEVYDIPVLDTDSDDQVATKIRNKINGAGGDYSASVNAEVVIITAKTAGAQTDTTVSVANSDVIVIKDVLTQGGTVTKEIKTISFNRSLVSGDVIKYNGSEYKNLSDLAAAIEAQSDVTTAVVSGKVITVTGDTVGNSISSITTSSFTTVPYAGTSGGLTNKVDFSSTFDNVKLMEGSTVLADNATLTYNSTTGETFITFKDFTLDASDEVRDAMLVADLAIYTTSGSETSARLGKFTIKALSTDDTDYLDVKGESSQEDYELSNELKVGTSSSDVTKEVSIVPVTVTVSIDNKFGNGDKYAKIKFTIDEGNNNINDNDVTITTITAEDEAKDVTVRNDDNETIGASQTVAANADFTLSGDLSIANGDTYEFRLSTDDTEVRLEANGIKYTVGGNEYEITNDSVIDLGTYSD